MPRNRLSHNHTASRAVFFKPNLPNLLIQFCLLTNPHPPIPCQLAGGFTGSFASCSISDPMVLLLQALQFKKYPKVQVPQKPETLGISSHAPQPRSPVLPCHWHFHKCSGWAQDLSLPSTLCYHLISLLQIPTLYKLPSKNLGIHDLTGLKLVMEIVVSQNRHKDRHFKTYAKNKYIK